MKANQGAIILTERVVQKFDERSETTDQSSKIPQGLTVLTSLQRRRTEEEPTAAEPSFTHLLAAENRTVACSPRPFRWEALLAL
jgi:hypothetical protein